MRRHITIYFDSENIKKYIKKSEIPIVRCVSLGNLFGANAVLKKYNEHPEELVVKNKSFEVEEDLYRHRVKYSLNMCLDSQEKIYTLNKLFDFFIKHDCFFYEKNFSLFDINKDLFYKSGYWFLNSEEYWIDFSHWTFNYLALTYSDIIARYYEHAINNNCVAEIEIRIDLDLGVIDFLVNKCKSELSKENYDKFIEKLIDGAYLHLDELIKNYGIKFFKSMRKNNILNLFLNSFKSMRKNNILDLFLNYSHESKCSNHRIVHCSIETNQTEIIDYLLKYGLEKDEVKLDYDDDDLLISLIKNDNVETFMYTIQNVSISNILIQKMIEGSGEFITKEYVKILLNNGKLDLENLELLKKSIKNNPDKKIKKYVKKLILNEKN